MVTYIGQILGWFGQISSNFVPFMPLMISQLFQAIYSWEKIPQYFHLMFMTMANISWNHLGVRFVGQNVEMLCEMRSRFLRENIHFSVKLTLLKKLLKSWFHVITCYCTIPHCVSLKVDFT